MDINNRVDSSPTTVAFIRKKLICSMLPQQKYNLSFDWLFNYVFMLSHGDEAGDEAVESFC